MRKTSKKYGLAALICTVFFLNLISLTYGEEMIPKPGTVIDKSNIMQFKHLFPEEFLPAFTDMWGLMDPISIIVGEPTQPVYLKADREVCEKNRGKYQLDAEGYVNAPSETIVGQPFYRVDPSDQNFALKCMWNYHFRYTCDDNDEVYFIQFTKRRAETRIGVDKNTGYNTYFTGRHVTDPKPYYKNTNNLRVAMIIKALYPPVNKNLINLMWTPLDPRLENTGFVYVPAFRRVLRTESSERSTPISNSVQAPDDFGVFMGRVPEFNCKYVGEQTVLGVQETNLKGFTLKEAKTKDAFPFDKECWEARKVFVIDITPKNPAYPQSLKRIYFDKETMEAYYGIAWDRAGALWKVWTLSYRTENMPDAHNQHGAMFSMWGADLQMGYTAIMYRGFVKYNHKSYAEGDYTASAVRGLAN